MAKPKGEEEKAAEKPGKEQLTKSIGSANYLIGLAEKLVKAGSYLNPDWQKVWYEECAGLAEMIESERLKNQLVLVPGEKAIPPASDPESLKPMVVTLNAVKSSLESSLAVIVEKEKNQAEKVSEAKAGLGKKIQKMIAEAQRLTKEGRERKTASGDPLDTDIWYVDCLLLAGALEGVPLAVLEVLRKRLSDPPEETKEKPLSKMLATLDGVVKSLTELDKEGKA